MGLSKWLKRLHSRLDDMHTVETTPYLHGTPGTAALESAIKRLSDGDGSDAVDTLEESLPHVELQRDTSEEALASRQAAIAQERRRRRGG